MTDLTGTPGNDTLIGDDGDNSILGSSGGDSLDGGGGRDGVAYWNSDEGVSINLATGAVSGGHAQGDTISNFEIVSGSSHGDTLIGDDGVNELTGHAGDDLLTGGEGRDTFYFAPEHGADTITDFTDGEDRIGFDGWASALTWKQVRASATSIDGGVRIDLAAHGGGAIDLMGVALADLDASDFVGLSTVAVPTPNADPAATERGDAGPNTLVGGAGDDKLWGEEGDDGLVGGDGADLIYGQAGNDRLVGGSEGDTFFGQGGGGPARSRRPDRTGVHGTCDPGGRRSARATGRWRPLPRRDHPRRSRRTGSARTGGL